MMVRRKDKPRPTPEPTVRRPYVDLRPPPVVTRLELHKDPRHLEVTLICRDTGMVVYTTPCNTLSATSVTGEWAEQIAIARALRFAKRHGLPVKS